MTPPKVSVVVVSRERPDALKRCLIGLSQVQYPLFEIVVVADPAGFAAAQSLSFAAQCRPLEFDQPNISQARNLGIAHAAGEIVAFIDDDAVPEPTWLAYLIEAFEPDTAAVGGFVRGRNGISFQWQARVLDALGHAKDIPFPDRAFTPVAPEGGAIKTEGTNMAIRREALIALGGFDPAFAFYLDETDLNMRLNRAGLITRLTPLAQVHHGFAPSRQRRLDRVPRDLFDIGASWAVFQRKHIPQEIHSKHSDAVFSSERARLMRYLVSGGLEPRDVRRLLHRLRAGFEAGQKRDIAPPALDMADTSFKAFPSPPRQTATLIRRWTERAAAVADATAAVADGEIVTLLLLSRTARKLRVSFEANGGFWLHQGGILGQTERNSPLIEMTTLQSKATRELERVRSVRDIGHLTKTT